jgi:hypothetical protein
MLAIVVLAVLLAILLAIVVLALTSACSHPFFYVDRDACACPQIMPTVVLLMLPVPVLVPVLLVMARERRGQHRAKVKHFRCQHARLRPRSTSKWKLPSILRAVTANEPLLTTRAMQRSNMPHDTGFCS